MSQELHSQIETQEKFWEHNHSSANLPPLHRTAPPKALGEIGAKRIHAFTFIEARCFSDSGFEACNASHLAGKAPVEKLADGARWDAAVAHGISLNASHVLLQGQARDEPLKPPFSWSPKEKYQAGACPHVVSGLHLPSTGLNALHSSM